MMGGPGNEVKKLANNQHKTIIAWDLTTTARAYEKAEKGKLETTMEMEIGYTPKMHL